MAADAYLLDQAEEADSVPTIRLYRWDEPSITIGYHQKIARAVDLSQSDGIPVVRRVTGGRALLHDDDELTYAMAGNFERFPKIGTTLHESYQFISRAIVGFYISMGWEAAMSKRDKPIPLSGSVEQKKGCFASVSQYEILARGQKVAAGSQRRTNVAMMQHGVIRTAPLNPHPAIADQPQAIAISRLPAINDDRHVLEKQLISFFQKEYRIQFNNCPFSDAEMAEIHDRTNNFLNLNLALI
jgi:hypothetical protein